MNILIGNSNYPLNYIYEDLCKDFNGKLISKKEELSLDLLKSLNPQYIFFPHWSYIIPSEIYENYNCIVFHMTDLPYGRGGSPLQNLILRGHKNTKISAIKVVEELDAGDIYLKKDLDLEGSAGEIYERAANVVVEMIKIIIETNPTPQPQHGKITKFKRRNPNESKIEDIADIATLHNFVRMLDAPNYPNAFIEKGNFRFEFTDSQIGNDGSLTAKVTIKKK